MPQRFFYLAPIFLHRDSSENWLMITEVFQYRVYSVRFSGAHSRFIFSLHYIFTRYSLFHILFCLISFSFVIRWDETKTKKTREFQIVFVIIDFLFDSFLCHTFSTSTSPRYNVYTLNKPLVDWLWFSSAALALIFGGWNTKCDEIYEKRSFYEAEWQRVYVWENLQNSVVHTKITNSQFTVSCRW